MDAVAVESSIADLARVAEFAKSLVGWALIIVGGSALALLQASYRRPRNRTVRCAWLLFVPGWSALLASIVSGTKAHRAYAAVGVSVSRKDLEGSFKVVNSAIWDQVLYFKVGLVCFLLWMAIYLAWWIWSEEDSESEIREYPAAASSSARPDPGADGLPLLATAVGLLIILFGAHRSLGRDDESG